MIVVCKNCKKNFEKRNSEIKRGANHFCSRSCSATVNNVGQQKNPPKLRVCKSCSVEFMRSKGHRSEFLCRDCAARYNDRSDFYKSRTLGQYHNLPSVKDKHPSWINAHVRNFARSWNAALTKLPCQKCGYAAHVELCHIVPISKWGLGAKLGEINHEDNLLSLCRNHHWELDHGHISLKDIPKR